MLKAATLITFLFMCRIGFADLLDPNCAKCGTLNITDAQEAKKLTDMMDAKTTVEKIKDGNKMVMISTKELKLGPATTITCRAITEDGKPIMRFRMSKPGCTIFKTEVSGAGGKDSEAGR